MVRLPQFEVFEKDLVKLIVIVLSGVNNTMIAVSVQGGHDARKPDNFGAGAYDSHDLHEIDIL
jgi:hypothetical protein